MAPPLPVEPTKGWWGYSIQDGEYWNGPFDTREDALAEAQRDYPDEACSTGFCIPHELDVPDLREMFVLWLHDGCTKGDIYADIVWHFEGANEDHNYEGEVGDEFAAANWGPLLADLKDIFAAALFRHGRPDLIPPIIEGARRKEPLVADDLDPLLVALENDAPFEAELTAAAEAWLVAQNLKDASRCLYLSDTHHHAAALEPEAS